MHEAHLQHGYILKDIAKYIGGNGKLKCKSPYWDKPRNGEKI